MTEPSQHLNTFSRLLQKGHHQLVNRDFNNLQVTCTQLAELFPNQLKTWILLARFGLQINQLEYAGRALAEAKKLPKSTLELEIVSANFYLMKGDPSRATAQVNNLRQIEINSAQFLTELAKLSYQLNQISWAKEFFAKALTLNPENSDLYYSLASIEQYFGNLEAALANCELALKFNPDHHEAMFLRSNLSKQTLQSNHFKELDAFIQRQPENSLARVMGCYALAKEYEDCKKFVQSFSWREKGAALYRQSFQYDVAQDVEFLSKIQQVYSSNRFAQSPSYNQGEQAIFILGLPRTGSTLVERIVTSHSEVESAGELTYFPNLLSRYIQQAQNNNSQSAQDFVGLTTSFDFQQLGRDYLELARNANNERRYFVDKFPQNALYAGLIHLALPNAKIILVEREPMDVCYAMYKQLFTNIYQFSYDLDELGDYYIAHHALMTHWKKCLGSNMLTIKYESLIEDYPTNSRKLIEFCDLDWQPQCNQFHENPQISATASAAQVRKPLYSSSVGMWKHYSTELASLKQRLNSLIQ
jgi:tetratricopeptide (TPR) repeat protein